MLEHGTGEMKACNRLVSLLPPKAYVRREEKQSDWMDGSLSWASTSPLTSPGLQRLHTGWRRPNKGSSWKLKRTELSSQLLVNFYRTTTESILCLQQQTAQGIEDHHLPQLDSFYTAWVWERSRRIVDDRTHPTNGLLAHLLSGKWCKNIKIYLFVVFA